jgi:hypothetical protein
LGLGFWASKTLLSSVELGVFTQLGQGPLPLDTLIDRLGLHRRAARDFLDALVALGILERDGEFYANTPATDLFLDRNKPGYVGPLQQSWRMCASIHEARHASSANPGHMGSRNMLLEQIYNPQRLSGFPRVLTNTSGIATVPRTASQAQCCGCVIWPRSLPPTPGLLFAIDCCLDARVLVQCWLTNTRSPADC